MYVFCRTSDDINIILRHAINHLLPGLKSSSEGHRFKDDGKVETPVNDG